MIGLEQSGSAGRFKLRTECPYFLAGGNPPFSVAPDHVVQVVAQVEPKQMVTN